MILSGSCDPGSTDRESLREALGDEAADFIEERGIFRIYRESVYLDAGMVWKNAVDLDIDFPNDADAVEFKLRYT